MAYKKLSFEEEQVIINKGTEAPFSGKYYEHNDVGNYHCKQCDAVLFSSENKFDSGCGWPSFDDEAPNSVKKILDKDGRRTEIVCANCGGHLGHIFQGEGFTTKDVRYCVNSISLEFVALKKSSTDQIAYFGAGCFWGVEYYFKKASGVKYVRSGYMGGIVENPSYEQVCTGKTDHIEVVEVVFDSNKTSYEDLCKLFFEIHNPEQTDGQGNDVGSQYLSVIFAVDKNQENIANKLIEILENKGLKIATKVLEAGSEADRFWPAELYHQGYYDKNGKKPYCHFYTKRF